LPKRSIWEGRVAKSITEQRGCLRTGSARELTGANTNQLALAEAAAITTGMRTTFYSRRSDLLPRTIASRSADVDGTYQPRSAISPTDALQMRRALRKQSAPGCQLVHPYQIFCRESLSATRQWVPRQ
jgi:hypothetical protein